jgi:hypothetical protein
LFGCLLCYVIVVVVVILSMLLSSYCYLRSIYFTLTVITEIILNQVF